MIELCAQDFVFANPLLHEVHAGAEIAGAVLSGHTKALGFLPRSEFPVYFWQRTGNGPTA